MNLQEALTDKELVKILGRRHIYALLDELYPDKNFALFELAQRTRLDLGNLSKAFTMLEGNGLIETWGEERERGRPFRYAKLTVKAQRLIASIKRETQPEEKVELEEWQIDELIKTIRDSGLSENLSKLAAHEFFCFCQKDPVYMTSKENVKQLFEEVVTNPTRYDGEIGELLRASISSFYQLVTNENRMDWAVTKLYPKFIHYMENGEEKDEIRAWAAKSVGDVARVGPDPAKKKEAEDKLFDVYFADDTKPESRLCEELRQQLEWLTSKPLFQKVQKKTNSQDPTEKAKAEMLLNGMIKAFLEARKIMEA
jgi:DNA-binding MarR family transcriptional regulator